jgi:hypothetical protein
VKPDDTLTTPTAPAAIEKRLAKLDLDALATFIKTEHGVIQRRKAHRARVERITEDEDGGERIDEGDEQGEE